MQPKTHSPLLVPLALVGAVVALILFWWGVFYVTDMLRNNHVRSVAKDLPTPPGCQIEKRSENEIGEVFGTSFSIQTNYACSDTTAGRVLEHIDTILKKKDFNQPNYSELEKKFAYPDVRARFSTNPTRDESLYISYELQDTSGSVLTAPDRNALNQLPVNRIYVEVSK